MCSSHALSRLSFSRNPLILHLSLSLHQLNTKPNTIKSHKIQGTKLEQLQHFFSWNKANIKHSCKSQLYKSITPTSPRKQACNHVSFLICLILYIPILFDQKLIKIARIMYTPILAFKSRLHLIFFLCMCYTFSSTKSYDMH